MNNSPYHRDVPQHVTFYIGPFGPPEDKKAYKTAIELNNRGDRSALDELLEVENEVLGTFAGRFPGEASPFKQLLSAILDRELGPVSTYVGTGFFKGLWAPALTIHLDQSEGADGTPLGHILQMGDGHRIAAALGRCLKADWIHQMWTYPVKPIEFEEQLQYLQ